MIDWVRDREGAPRLNENGYVLTKPSGACFALQPDEMGRLLTLVGEVAPYAGVPDASQCPKCREPAMIRMEGKEVCLHCGVVRRGFSDFIRNASSEEKADVYERVIDESIAAQQTGHICTPDIYNEATGNHLCGTCGKRV